MASTAAAASYVAQTGDKSIAAVAAPGAAALYGLEVLAKNVQITDANKTRFYVLSRQGLEGEGLSRAALVATCGADGIDDIIVTLHDAGLELYNLAFVHQQTPRPYRVTVKDVAVFVGADMHTADKQLAVLDGTEAVLQVDLAGTDRLDLGTGKLNPRLKALEHEIFMKRLTVVGDLFYAKLLRQGASPLSTAS
jgi:hypothetical protein